MNDLDFDFCVGKDCEIRDMCQRYTEAKRLDFPIGWYIEKGQELECSSFKDNSNY